MGLLKKAASGVPCLRRAYSAEAYEGRKRLRVYAPKRFTAQAGRPLVDVSPKRRYKREDGHVLL